MLDRKKNKIKKQHGSYLTPNTPLWKNTNEYLEQLPCQQYYSGIRNMSFHNLCTHNDPPEGVKQLLGLGLKFCIQSRRPQQNTINTAINRLERDTRLRYRFAEADDTDLQMEGDYDPKLYIKSTWNPPYASKDVEERLQNFHAALEEARSEVKKNTTPSTNISPSVENLLNEVAANKDIIVLITDKNLGPAIMDRKEYISSMLEEHLLNTTTYQQISETEAYAIQNKFREEVNQILNEFEDQLTISEKTYFERGLKTKDRIPLLYGTPKVHKERTKSGRIKFRPVTSQCGSLFDIVSTYIDRHLQDLVRLTPSYVKNSREVLQRLRDLHLPPGSKLFTSDAESMYTNIDPEDGLKIIELYINEYGHEYKCHFPKDLLLRLLRLVMTTSIFNFGNTYWRQLIGTAMGTSCACAYATLFFAYFERKNLSTPTYTDNLQLYIRFIDDIFGVWVETKENPTNFHNFEKLLNEQCKLEWITEEPTNEVDFLDLSIRIKQGKIETKTYEKTENLFLYIPYSSAHPPGLLKSLVYGRVGTYWEQNTRESDFGEAVRRLYIRLTDRGYPDEILAPEFIAAAEKLDATTNTVNIEPKDTSNRTDLYFHIPFHPKDVYRRKIQLLYKEHCVEGVNGFNQLETKNGSIMSVRKMTVAYSRPKNLRDHLVQSHLVETDTVNVEKIMKDIKNQLPGNSQSARN